MDLLSILPEFAIKSYSHILPPLERSNINTVDLISLDTLEIAKRAHVPPADVRRLSHHVIKALHHDVGFEESPVAEQDEPSEPSSTLNFDTPLIPGPRNKLDLSQWCAISTLDPALDALLNGGIPVGYVTEVTGESGSGKTQFLLSLLLAVQLPAPRGAGKSAVYISTEAPLATTRLSQLIESHPYLAGLERDRAPSLERILSINAMDLESQDHILNYQLPVAIKRYNVGLVVMDSITSNYRAEHTAHNLSGLSTRSGELAKLGHMLRNLAVTENLAIVVANQVSDRFDREEGPSLFARVVDGTPSSSPATQPPRESGAASPPPFPQVRPPDRAHLELSQNTLAIPPFNPVFPSSSSSPQPTQDDPQQPFDGSYLVGNPVRNGILSLQHQQRFFTGWGDSPEPFICSTPSLGFQRSTAKTPTLGLVWSTQIACRIALKKEDWPASPALPESEAVHPGGGRGGGNAALSPPSNNAPSTTTANSSSHLHSIPPPPQMIERPVRRTMKLVFSPWSGGSPRGGGIPDEVDFEIWKGGLRNCLDDDGTAATAATDPNDNE
ncbi:hypothetical protein ARAM_003283 [Aspergillus rambellii]|uniref:RecA family profile 1 domain-containing protein n=1 Tax=Aspergillus rambellii TaxID=308745 RepID=A0A0F8X0Q0_9EURO|nr:hypothetical protein ARAM_003283 [Aspergillus rambellii]